MKRREPAIVDPATHPRRYVNLATAAEYLSVSVRAVQKFIDAGSLPATRFGRVRRVKPLDLAAFEERQRVRGR